MRMTVILECQKLNMCVQLSVPNKRYVPKANEISLVFFLNKNVTF